MNTLEIAKTTIISSQIDNYNSLDNDLTSWANKYFATYVINSPPHTQRAKWSDINKFISYYTLKLQTSNINLWTSAVTKGFQSYLQNQLSLKTRKPYTATSINRILATISHFANWLLKRSELPYGNPFSGVHYLSVEDPEWNGLSHLEITRLKSACEDRMRKCKKSYQNPLLEYTIFMILLSTGLRESELANLNRGQYHSYGFHNVKRKGNKLSRKIPVVNEAKNLLDKYLQTRTDMDSCGPLFLNKNKKRIKTRDIARVCDRIATQANTQADYEPKIKLTPHMLRHTFLKRVADRHGVHVAQNLSGNVSIKEIFRYTKPSNDQKYALVAELF